MIHSSDSPRLGACGTNILYCKRSSVTRLLTIAKTVPLVLDNRFTSYFIRNTQVTEHRHVCYTATRCLQARTMQMTRMINATA